MKRFIWKISLLIMLCTIVSMFICYLVDPFNVFHWKNIRNNGIEPNKNYIKTKYILENKDKFDGFLFGSSRIGSIHVENIDNYKIYNMTYPSGTPRENLETLKTFIENDVKVNIIYLGVDSFSYTEDSRGHYTQQLRCPYQQLNIGHFIKLYLNPTIVGQSIPFIINGGNIDGIDVFYKYGWWCDYDTKNSVKWDWDKPSIGEKFLLNEALSDIDEIKKLCDKNDIKLIVFTNPMYKRTYQESIKKDYYKFLRRLAKITEYYNFSGINDITENTDNYIDISHYDAYVGDMMLMVITKGKKYNNLYDKGFGWSVTEENVEELIDVIG